MPRRSKIVNISVPPELFNQVVELAKQRGVSRSQLFKEAIRNYVDEERQWLQIRMWGAETARKLGIRDEEDVEKIREEYAKETV